MIDRNIRLTYRERQYITKKRNKAGHDTFDFEVGLISYLSEHNLF